MAFLGGFYAAWRGIKSIQGSGELPYFRLRRQQLMRGWRLLFSAAGLSALAVFLGFFAEPFAYTVIEVTTTPTLTPTITLTPSMTLSPTITLTPSITPTLQYTYTPTITPTAFVPASVYNLFESQVTPNPDAAFSEFVFAQGLDALYRPIGRGTIFQNPVGHIYALFSYDKMLVGVQWTALWFRNGEMVYFETKPWDGATGGFGFTDWEPEPGEWLPGNYLVQIFVGLEWKRSGEFVVEGSPPTLTPSATATGTPTLTPTITPTQTPWPTQTRTPMTPSVTPQPTLTRTATSTSWPTVTNTPLP
ncbi:MAG: hypothetical protein OEZ02_04095 [Anaerolineae bacterium]|nr:hypothetical protein [Anaerolineae bacterium]